MLNQFISPDYNFMRSMQQGNYHLSMPATQQAQYANFPQQRLWPSPTEISPESCKKVSKIIKNEKEDKSMFSSLREYLREHRDLVWSVLLALALDHYFFQDKFRNKIAAIVDNLLSKHLPVKND